MQIYIPSNWLPFAVLVGFIRSSFLWQHSDFPALFTSSLKGPKVIFVYIIITMIFNTFIDITVSNVLQRQTQN